MTRKGSNILCPRCRRIGFLTKRWVKRTVNIPKVPKPEYISSLAIAWDYAARVCLRMRENLILWPSQGAEDHNVEGTGYELFSGFSTFSVDQIEEFELRHLSTPSKNARRKIYELKTSRPKTTESYEYNSNKLPPRDTIHISFPHSAGHITKPSIVWLYGTIVCLVLRDISKNLPLPKYIIEEFGMSIIMNFNLFIEMIDNRHSVDFIELFRLCKDVKDGSGHHAASAASSTATNLCKYCSKNVRKDSSDFVEMEFNVELQNWVCPRCGGTEALKVRALTPKYIRKIKDKVFQKAEDVSSYLPLLENVRSMYSYILNKEKDDFLKRFEEYETLAVKDLLFKKEVYFMTHYDSSKKWKKKACYIAGGQAYIHSNDSRYSSEYEPLINELAKKVSYNSELMDKENNLLSAVSGVLEGIGWPRRYVREKIEADIAHLKFSSF
jgi:hypothetical protein